MSIKEIINELEGLRFILECKRDRERAETGVFRASSSRLVAINAAISLLRTHPEAQPNEQLTLEELREMDGEPVWTHSDIFPGDCGWRVIKKAGVLDVEFTDGLFFRLTDYEKSWVAYRRPPKEDGA